MEDKNLFFKNLNMNPSVINSLIEDICVGIYIDEMQTENYYSQVILETTVNLVARVYTNIKISVPNKEIELKYNQKMVSLNDFILRVGRSSRQGNEDNIVTTVDLTDCNVVIAITNHELKYLQQPVVYIAANGWLAGISLNPLEMGNINDNNPTGAIVAACLGVAEIFKITFKDHIKRPVGLLSEPLIFSALDYKNNSVNPANPPVYKLELEDVVLFGAGSVGSALLYAMKYIREVYGVLQIVDTDKEIDFRNLLRYGYLTVKDVQDYEKVTKVTWAKEKLSIDCPKLQVIPKGVSVSEYTNQIAPFSNINLAISAVDNIYARRDITDLLAKRVINAGTGDVRFTISRHGFADGNACLYCNYLNLDNPPASNYQQYATMTKLPMDRIYKLFEDNDTINDNDLDIMEKNHIIESKQRQIFKGKPLLSFIHERFYGQVHVNTENKEKVVTLAFVTVLAGCFLFGEMIKEILELRNHWEGNMYEQDLLMLPNEMFQVRKPHSKGLCLCQNSFRRMVYQEKYS